jgi:hypothetical protein
MFLVHALILKDNNNNPRLQAKEWKMTPSCLSFLIKIVYLFSPFLKQGIAVNLCNLLVRRRIAWPASDPPGWGMSSSCSLVAAAVERHIPALLLAAARCMQTPLGFDNLSAGSGTWSLADKWVQSAHLARRPLLSPCLSKCEHA